MGAVSPPSRLFEDLLERFLVTVGVGEESVMDGTGSDMLRKYFDDNTLVGLSCVIICCMLYLCLVSKDNYFSAHFYCAGLKLFRECFIV